MYCEYLEPKKTAKTWVLREGCFGAADDRLFNSIVFYEQHLLHWLLTERHYTNYNLSLDHGAMTALC